LPGGDGGFHPKPLLTSLRREVIDLFLAEHPLHCVTCEKAGSCLLQKYAYEFDIRETSYEFRLDRTLYQDDNPFFVRDHQYCILCGRCVRACDEVVGASAIDFAGHGYEVHIATPFDSPLAESTCVFCGSCVQVCPTAALMPVSRQGKGREWEMERAHTICGYCGVGCQIEYARRDGKIIYANSTPDAPVNGEFLCSKGRYGWDFATSHERLTHPMIRRDLAFQLGLSAEPWGMPQTSPLDIHEPDLDENYIRVDWDTALDVVADRLAQTVQKCGPDAVMGLSSARCTNEENYLFQKFIRVGIGTNNIDHCARLCHASTVAGLAQTFGSGAMTNPIHEIRDADCIFITGSNTSEAHPVISYEVVRAVKRGANLIIVDPRRIPLADHATLFLQAKPGTDGYVFMAMMHTIIREGWLDESFIARRTEGFAEFEAVAMEYPPERASLLSGVPVAQIEAAARMYALGERAKGQSIYADGRGHSTILYAMGITQRSNGTELVMTLANLAMLCGQIGKPSTGVNPLRGQSNVQGACDVGCLVNVLPGYQNVTDESKRQAMAQLWGVDTLPDQIGLTVVEAMKAASEGKVRAIYVMGENPMMTDPNLSHVEPTLRKVDFLVVQDIFPSETAQLAHVILPAASSLEKDGTFTNTERRVQLLHPVIAAPGEARPDWQIVGEIAVRFDQKMGRARAAQYWQFPSSQAIFSELAAVTPIYRGMDYARLAEKGLSWPCPDFSHPGTPILHTRQFTRGLGKFSPAPPRDPAEMPDEEYPLILSTGRILYHYHSGTMTRRSEPLAWRVPDGHVEINPIDAKAAGIESDQEIVLRSRRGSVNAKSRITQRVPPGTVFLAFHWREAPANMLTQDFALDPVAKIPEFKICSVRLEKV
jgi:formate dehydrogenase (NADP+) alpha subunit